MDKSSHLIVRRQRFWVSTSRILRNVRYARRASYNIMKNHENESAVLKMIGQYLELVIVFLRKLHPIGLTTGQIKSLIEEKDHPFWVAFNEATKLLTPPSLDDDMARQIEFWSKVYKEHFSIDLDLSGVKIPERKSSFNWLVIVARGVSLDMVWEVCRKHFKCWKYTDLDLENVIQESERGPAKATVAFWFRDRVEADEETKNLSANQQTEPSITFIVRCLLELKYFLETKKHLDINNLTLCAGSRYSDGYVPCAYWYDDGFHIYWNDAGNRSSSLRSRVAVG